MVVILTGSPGAGKSTVGQALAERLDWAFVELDATIEATAGRTIPTLFKQEGEAGFRAREREAVRALAADPPAPCVIATGGWTCGDPAGRALLESLGPVICLTGSAAALAARLDAGEPGARPLLAAADPARIEHLLALRQSVYDSFPLQVDTDERTPAAVVEHVLQLVRSQDAHAKPLTDDAHERPWWPGTLSIPVRAPVDPAGPRGPRPGYGVLVGAGLLDRLGSHLATRGIVGRAVVVTDTHVGPHYAERALASLAAAGIDASRVELPAGESAKTLATVADLYAAFVAAGLDRDGTVIALGGGVVGDTAGFAAATYLRGVALVTVPTSLLAMVDAAIGGKTGVNLAAGKNLAGAFKQPVLVVADPALLATLPPKILREGLAEVVKAALIADPDLFAALERTSVPELGNASAWLDIVARAVRVKAEIVSADPREHGRRLLLNLGHTFGHALEKATGFALPHGHAVAIGLVAAARLAERQGIVEQPGLADRVEALLSALGLPVRWSGPTAAEVLAAMGVDKKRRGGQLRFVLPIAMGDVGVVDVVPEAEVGVVVESLRARRTTMP